MKILELNTVSERLAMVIYAKLRQVDGVESELCLLIPFSFSRYQTTTDYIEHYTYSTSNRQYK